MTIKSFLCRYENNPLYDMVINTETASKARYRYYIESGIADARSITFSECLTRIKVTRCKHDK